MDERALNELLECSVCLERLDDSSKVLPCQHTFCRRCLEEIVTTKQELRCPECRSLVEIRVEDLPSNILLIRLLEGMKNAKAGISQPPSQCSPSNAAAGSSHHRHSSLPGHGAASGGHKHSQGSKTPPATHPCAKALYNYEAKEPGDLSFKKSDLITLQKQVDENWYHGELNGQHGFFPATYVQVITPLPQEIPKCKALYDFIMNDKNEKDCLMFHKDDVLTVIRRVDDNWAEGKMGERIGIFPISFVEMNDAAKWLINNGSRASSSVISRAGSSASGSSSDASPTETTPTTSTSSTPTTTIRTSPSNVNVTNPNLSAVQRINQKRHSLTVLSSHHRGLVPSSANPQHRHSMELSTTFSALGSTPSILSPLTPTQTELSSSSTSSPSSSLVTMASSSSPKASTSSSSACPQVSARVSSNHPSQSVSLSGTHTPTNNGQPNSLPTSVVPAAPPTPSIYVALYSYKPRKDDEIELRKGDYYTVQERCQDGWYKGTCLREGTSGVFPGNYVQHIKLAKQSSSSRANAHGASMVNGIGPGGQPSGKCSPASQPGLIKACHVTVSRAHSFPKSSPLGASLDYKVRHGHDGHSRVPNVSVSPAGGTPTRNTSGLVHGAVTSPHSAASHSSRTHPSSSSQTVAVQRSTPQNCTPVNSVIPSLAQQRVPSPAVPCGPRTNLTAEKIAARGSSNSPRTSRKASRHAAGSSSSQQGCSSLEMGQPMPPHSMMDNTVITPPNVVIGAVGGEGDMPSLIPPVLPHRDKDRDKKDRREKNKLSLVKRLTKKSKSPPPNLQAASSSGENGHHQRSGSLPSNDIEGATAGSSHHKSRSLDSNTHPPPGIKPPRTKPLLRERYRCIVPYPPQSDIELELKVGDIVYVHKKRNDGWYKGTLQRTGKTGLFPGSFVDSF